MKTHIGRMIDRSPYPYPHLTVQRDNGTIVDQEHAAADAALIVKAVNSYEAMREALEKIIAYRDRVDPIHFQLEKMDHFLAQARKALALAEGKE